jgi:hypothetical protein
MRSQIPLVQFCQEITLPECVKKAQQVLVERLPDPDFYLVKEVYDKSIIYVETRAAKPGKERALEAQVSQSQIVRNEDLPRLEGANDNQGDRQQHRQQ